jgi:chromodomain-helicase-DNA-binding protein 7
METPVETISEERANRCLQRIDLLNKVRIDVLKNGHFDEWVMSRCAPSADLPDWYIPGEHDRDLIRAASRYGITRTEFYYVQDTEFSFKRYLYKYLKHIESLMAQEAALTTSSDEERDAIVQAQDPIQYYFQNQAKIQVSFKELLSREQEATQKTKKKKIIKKKIVKKKIKKATKVAEKEATKEATKDTPKESPKESPKEEKEEEKKNDPVEEEKKEEKVEEKTGKQS